MKIKIRHINDSPVCSLFLSVINAIYIVNNVHNLHNKLNIWAQYTASLFFVPAYKGFYDFH